jgi:transcriptional regulator with XRE-family HTH domain
MVDTNRLKSVIVLNGKTQEDVAKHLGMSPKTFYLRMKNGVFGSDEIEEMIDYLNIEEPMPIFFAKTVTR